MYPFSHSTLGGFNYFLLSVDEYSGYLVYIPCKIKRADELENAFAKLIAHYNKFGHTIVNIVTDSESVLVSLDVYFSKNQIKLQHSPPYQHAQRVERYIQTLNARVRTVLDSLPYDLPGKLYGELIHSCIVHMNDLPNSLHPTLSPSLLFKGDRLDITRRILIPFGTLAMFHHAGKEQNKYIPRSELGIVLGPAVNSHSTVRCYLFRHKKVYIRSQLTELSRLPHNFAWKLKQHLSADNNDIISSVLIPAKSLGGTEKREEDNEILREGDIERFEAEEYREFNTDVIEVHKKRTLQEATSDLEDMDGEDMTETQPLIEEGDRYPKRRRVANWKDGPARIREAVVQYAFRISIRKSLEGPYAEQSKEAILDEVRNMIDYKVGHYVRKKEVYPSLARNVVRGFMFIKHKMKPDGSYDKTKARFVTDGKNQGSHLYDIISSSMVSLTTVLLMLNVATLKGWRVTVYDIKAAFMNNKRKEGDPRIIVVVPKDVAVYWVMIDPTAQEFLTPEGELYMELDVFMYGLKQAPMMFYTILNSVIREL